MSDNRVVIVGATSAIAEECARLWIKEVSSLVLLARNKEKLDEVIADLQVRNPNLKIKSFILDFLNLEDIRNTVQKIGELGSIDTVLIAQGFMAEQSECQQDLKLIEKTILINALSPILFCELFLQIMEQANKGNLAIISSVAGDRGRKSNYIYGSAKALLNNYVGGLQHRFHGTDVNISLIKPGPTSTPMTYHLEHQSFAKPSRVATDIVNGIKKRKAVVYSPGKWKFIMLIIKLLPSKIFNRLEI